MSSKKNLTQKQQYLQHLLPKLDDVQVDKMIAVAIAKEKKRIDETPKEEKDPYKELMSMIGCKNAKMQMNAMLADFRMKKIAAARGRKHARAYYHAAFIGNPGSNKSSTSRLFAKVLAREGIIKNPRLVELTRSDIVGQFVGSTAAKVNEIFRKYAGCAILIDEAYSLCDGDRGSNNYGDEAINEIIVCLENHPDTVVIFAGYPDRMEEFLAANPGLRSRVPYKVIFEDYSAEELVGISKVIAAEQGFEISDSASDKLFEIYSVARTVKDFGNGRYARNVIEAAVRKKGVRLGVMDTQNLTNYMDCEKYSDEELFSLDESCFEGLQDIPQECNRRIGFYA